MKVTRIPNLVAWSVLAATGGYLAPKFLVANGGQVPVATFSFILTLPLISIILLVFALPMIRRYRAGSPAAAKSKPASSLAKPSGLLNPFYAVRVVLLAKATAIAGAIFLGWQSGVLWFQVSSPVITEKVWPNLAALIGAIVMVVVGIVIERVCRIRDGGDAAAPKSEGKSAGSGAEVNPA
ncbi:MAG: hypothetical protein RIS82_359 [Actinomycetota bacterium]|jgi:hypothetical protein